MCTIKFFQNKMFGQLRVAEVNGKVLFNLSDVCKALSIGNARNVKSRLDERGVHSIDTPTINQHGTKVMQKMTYIDEPNVYRCIFQSRKGEAQMFQDWVFEEVLPQIRKTGGYVPVAAGDDENAILSKALLIAQRTLSLQRQQLLEQEPKVAFAEALTASDGTILIRDLAKLLTQNGYPIGQNRLFKELRQRGYLFQQSTRPIQRYVEQGIFVTHVVLVETHHGTKELLTTRVTAKGQQYFLNVFLNEIN